MQRVTINKFLTWEGSVPIIDVRSPAEYAKGHIPGAINIPIFTDLERAKIGTVYKQKSKKEAISLGLEIVGPKMNSMTEMALEHAINNHLNVYCWRGGMRSEKMAWLFELVGIKITVLEGGYKAFRNYLHSRIEDIQQLFVLQGPTGSGKTDILNALYEIGEQVIDLEGLARHKGSAFGGLGESEQPTTEQFQNSILEILDQFDLSKPVWVESESITIGRVYLPEELWHKMNSSRIISIEVPRKLRIQHIIDQYGHFESKILVSRIEKLKKRLGGKRTSDVIKLVESGDLHPAVDILLDYYDKSYDYSSTKYKKAMPFEVKIESMDPSINARKLLEQVAEKQV